MIFAILPQWALTILLLSLPLFWLGGVYLGSIVSLLVQSFYTLDSYTGQIIAAFTFDNYLALTTASNIDIVRRTLTMAILVTACSILLAFPLAYYMAFKAKLRFKALFYLAILLPLWSSYIVRVYAWKLILAKEGITTWLLKQMHLNWLLEGILSLPVVGGSSLSFSYMGTFLVFLYVWLPYMILPIESALQKIPRSYQEASKDLGASPFLTFYNVTLPLAVPGVVAGSIFTFSLTLGDYIIPSIIGNSSLFIGQMVYVQQGTAGNIPLAAAMTAVPIVIMIIYLYFARKTGAFDAL